MHPFRFILLTVLAAAACLRAEVSELTPVAKLFAQAEVVLHGKVLSSSTLKDGTGELFTEVEYEEIATWKGKVDAAKERIVHSGGVLGEEMALASGQVEYLPGEEFLAFLVRNSRGELVTIGMNLGKFRIENGTAVRLHEKVPFSDLNQIAKGVLK